MAVKESLKTKDEKLESTLKDIEKMFGKGSVMKLGERPNVSYDIIHSGSLLIDNVLGSFLSFLNLNFNPLNGLDLITLLEYR